MTASEYLGQFRAKELVIQAMLDKIQSLRELLESSNSKLAGMPRSPSPNLQPIHTVVCEIVDLETAANTTIDELINAKREAIDCLASLDKRGYARLLELRYVHGYTWDDVAAIMKLCKRHVIRMDKKAKECLDERMQYF